MGPLGGWSAHHTSALALLFGVALAHLGLHAGGGIIVQYGGAMALYSSSTATVSDTDFTSCSAGSVRDGPTSPTPITCTHTAAPYIPIHTSRTCTRHHHNPPT